MRATAYSFGLGWCFLPVAGYPVPGLPDYTKMFATTLGTLLGVLVFHPELVFQCRPSPLDIPAIVFCICPFASSMTNDLGAYDGLSAVANQTITWGLPYGIGRLVYRSAADVTQLGEAMIVCGVVYIPFCLWEVMMSPQLHYQLYGFYQHSLAQTVRGGGWRPMVFMQHGLQVALWMCGCLVLCFSHWWLGRRNNFGGIKIVWLLAALAITFVLLKSTGAYLLALLGIGTIAAVRASGTFFPLLLLPMMVMLFLPLRINEIVTGRSLVDWVQTSVSDARAESLEFRLNNEDRLLAKAKKQWMFGWGGWGRNHVYDEQGKDITVTDGLWIIELGTHGVLGLASLFGLLLSGVIAIALSGNVFWEKLKTIEIANVVGISIICTLSAIDSIPNAMVLPIFTLSAGAIVSMTVQRRLNNKLGCE